MGVSEKRKVFLKHRNNRTKREDDEIKALEKTIAEGAPASGTNPLLLSGSSEESKPSSGSGTKSGKTDPNPASVSYSTARTFDDLPLSQYTKDALHSSGFVTLTAIQRAALPHALAGRDVLGAAKTGSGKTLSFLIPVVEKLYRSKWSQTDGLGALILTPTRELAMQIFEELKKVGKNHELSAGLLIGGKTVKAETNTVGKMNILVCTPGRLLQHMDETPGFDCTNTQMLVLDEADRILDMGFAATLDAIIANLPKERTTMLFSATQTKSVKDLARLSLADPEYLAVHSDAAAPTPLKLDQAFAVVGQHEKLDVLWGFIKAHLRVKTIVRFVHEAFKKLRPGIPVRALHGEAHKAVADRATAADNSASSELSAAAAWTAAALSASASSRDLHGGMKPLQLLLVFYKSHEASRPGITVRDKAEADKAVAGKATAADNSALSELSAAAALTAATLSASALSCALHGGMKPFKLLSVFYESQQVSASTSPNKCLPLRVPSLLYSRASLCQAKAEKAAADKATGADNSALSELTAAAAFSTAALSASASSCLTVHDKAKAEKAAADKATAADNSALSELSAAAAFSTAALSASASSCLTVHEKAKAEKAAADKATAADNSALSELTAAAAFSTAALSASASSCVLLGLTVRDKAKAEKAVSKKATAADNSALSELSAAAAFSAAALSASASSCALLGGLPVRDKAEAEKAVSKKATAADNSALSELSAAAAFSAAALSASASSSA
eukprot:gene24607-10227_t